MWFHTLQDKCGEEAMGMPATEYQFYSAEIECEACMEFGNVYKSHLKIKSKLVKLVVTYFNPTYPKYYYFNTKSVYKSNNEKLYILLY